MPTLMPWGPGLVVRSPAGWCPRVCAGPSGSHELYPGAWAPAGTRAHEADGGGGDEAGKAPGCNAGLGG